MKCRFVCIDRFALDCLQPCVPRTSERSTNCCNDMLCMAEMTGCPEWFLLLPTVFLAISSHSSLDTTDVPTAPAPNDCRLSHRPRMRPLPPTQDVTDHTSAWWQPRWQPSAFNWLDKLESFEPW